jgi:hypothetical protein
MKLRIRALQIRVEAENGLFGCDMTFPDGLVLLRAENSKGKSTCLMSILYALGLEGMLGASHQVPLQPVLLSEIGTDDGDDNVIGSYVRVEIEGQAGTVTVTRTVAGDTNVLKRVSVVFGPDLTQMSNKYEKKDFFVRTKGDADSEHGFHAFLADFVGWELPVLTRFDGTRTILYLACIAPYFFVDQLSGWRDIKARMPTYLQIPEMSRRTAEYILSLDVLRIAIANIELAEQQEMLKKRWSDIRQRFLASLPRIGIASRGLPDAMPSSLDDVLSPSLLISVNDEWITLENHANAVMQRADELAQRDVPSTSTASTEAVQELARLEGKFAERLRRFEEQQVEARLARDQVAAIEKRLADLREDYRQQNDDLRLRKHGGTLKIRSAGGECPTCGQQTSGVLVPEGAAVRPMLLEENIAFISNQIATFREMHSDAVRTATGRAKAMEALSAELEALGGKLRAQKELLWSRTNSPSVSDIHERLSLQVRLVQLDQAKTALKELEVDLNAFKVSYREYLDDRTLAGSERLTDSDRTKLNDLEMIFLSQLQAYQFESYRVERLSIDPYTYRPSNEGVDLGITSASDAIRVVWAYLLGLLEVSRLAATNHPGVLIFDEPKQQMVKGVSFEALMQRAATSAEFGQQVIFGTSQPVAEIEQMLRGRPYKMLDFGDQRIIRRLGAS